MSADTLPAPGSPAFYTLSKRERDVCTAYHDTAPDATPESPVRVYDLLNTKEREWLENYFTMGRNQTAASRAMGYQAPEKHGARMSKNVGVKAAIQERLAGLEIRANDVLYRVSQRAEATAEDFVSFDTIEHRPLVRVPLADAVEITEQEIADLEALSAPASAKGAEAWLDRITALKRKLVDLEARLEAAPDGEALVPGPPEAREVARFDLVKMRDAGKLHLVKSVKRNTDGSFSVELHDAAKADELLAKHLGLLTDRLDVTSGGKEISEIRVTIAEPRQRRLAEQRAAQNEPPLSEASGDTASGDDE